MNNTIIKNSLKVSVVIQIITGIFGLYGLKIPVKAADLVLKEVLGLEMIVQLIELVFYAFFIFFIDLSSITQKRYYDWFLSTPIMLFTISLYFFYVNFIETKENFVSDSLFNNEDNIDGDEDTQKNTFNLIEFTKTNSKQIAGIIFLNFLMLLFGFLGELGVIRRITAFSLGTLSLCGSFGIIYTNYAKYSEQTKNMFWIMFSIWSLYGFAFLLPHVPKNIGYTILDIFAKNFFGVFLYYKISQKRI